MSEVTFNEEVTATELNNIAVDLGMTEFSYFENDMPYAVHQLNQITADLVSSGVLRTEENRDLGCKVTMAEGRVIIDAGIIVFESGAKLRITTPVGVSIMPGTVIYALYDSATGNASIEVSKTTPSGDYVLLAAVNEDGTIADRRSSCVARVTMPGDAQNVYREVTVTYVREDEDNDVVAVDVGTSAFSYVFIKSASKSGHTRVPSFQNAFYLTEEEQTKFYLGKFTNGDTTDTLYITKKGQYLYVDFSKCDENVKYTINLVAM